MVVMKPYKDTILNENIRVRYFEQGVSADDMVWHRDEYDRIVEVIDGEGWLFQRDNKVPQLLDIGESIEISAGEWHRLIPGETDLIITITERKLSKKQMKIAKAAPPPDKITGADFAALRKDEVGMDEGETDFDKGGEPSYRDGRTPAQIARQKKLTIKLEKCKTEECRKKVYAQINKSRAAERTAEGTVRITEAQLDVIIDDAIEEEKLDAVLNEIEDLINEKRRKRRKRKGKKRKRKSAGRTLSKAVKKSLDKKADRRCLTRGSVYAEFRAGLGAYYTSGSRKGMSAHQWAHARVNSANPSKKWAKVKKRKKCPKKKKK
jgi:hypothetical protein